MFQVDCPKEWIGKTFGELQSTWMRAKDTTLADSGPVTILAVYRQAYGNDTVHGCNITVPPASFVLMEGDLLTVLGSREFAKAARSLGLLHDGEDWDPADKKGANRGCRKEVEIPRNRSGPMDTMASTDVANSPRKSTSFSLDGTTSAYSGIEYTIVLDKTAGMQLGIDVDNQDGNTLLIEGINEGLIAMWNKDNPENPVRVGDRIIEVNGINNDLIKLVDESKKAQKLTFKLVASPVLQQPAF